MNTYGGIGHDFVQFQCDAPFLKEGFVSWKKFISNHPKKIPFSNFLILCKLWNNHWVYRNHSVIFQLNLNEFATASSVKIFFMWIHQSLSQKGPMKKKRNFRNAVSRELSKLKSCLYIQNVSTLKKVLVIFSLQVIIENTKKCENWEIRIQHSQKLAYHWIFWNVKLIFLHYNTIC